MFSPVAKYDSHEDLKGPLVPARIQLFVETGTRRGHRKVRNAGMRNRHGYNPPV